jgi:hypothetical protein
VDPLKMLQAIAEHAWLASRPRLIFPGWASCRRRSCFGVYSKHDMTLGAVQPTSLAMRHREALGYSAFGSLDSAQR